MAIPHMTRYQGGKNGAGVYQTIINAIPWHFRYVEAFAGSAAVFRHKAPAAGGSWLIERSLGQAATLRRDLASSGAMVLQGDALGILLAWAWQPHDFVYLDPPYHPATRRDLDLYEHELSAADHDQLLSSVLPTLSDRHVKWALSGYRCAAYDDAAARDGWHRIDYQAMTRRGVVTESLWTNYDPAAVSPHDYKHLGDDFRERERIARKIRRWVMRLQQLPQRERAAIMSALASTGETGDGARAPARIAAAGGEIRSRLAGASDGRPAPGAIAAPGGASSSSRSPTAGAGEGVLPRG